MSNLTGYSGVFYMLYAMLLALFLPLGLMFSHSDQRRQEHEQGVLQSMLFYVDQLRVALPNYRVADPGKEGEVPFTALSFPEMGLAARSEVKHYVDDQGFYIAWERPKPGLAHALVKHYSRASGEAAHLIFYHIGFVKEESGKKCLVPSRNYQNLDLSKNSCAWPLPLFIKEGALVLTDREPVPTP